MESLRYISAVKSAEGSSEGEHSGKRVGWGFFWQTPGSMAPYVVALLLLQLPHLSWITSLQVQSLHAGRGKLTAAMLTCP